MTKKTRILALLLVCALALIVPGCDQGKVEVVEPQKATTFTQLMIDSKANQDVLTVQGHSTHTADLLVLEQSDGTEVFVVDYAGALSSSGAVTFADDVTFTLGADEKVLVDGATTAHTETDGVLDVNAATITADVSAVDIAMTQSDGATTAEDAFGMVMTLTADDADGDLFGISISAATTAAAAANSYEAGILYDCAVTTATACIDGMRLTSSGVNLGMTDGLDVSDSNILNAVNIGSNLVAGGNSESISVGATDNSFIFTVDSTNTATFIGADASSPADTTYDTTGAGSIILGSDDVLAVTIDTDATGDDELVLPLLSVSAGEMTDDTITFAQISDSSAVDADTTFTLEDGIELVITATHTTGVTEILLFDVDQPDGSGADEELIVVKIEATSESTDAGDTFTGISLVWEDGTANTIMDAAISIDNLEDTASTMTDAIIVTSSGVNTGVTDGLDVSATNILNAINIGANLILGDPTHLDTLSLATDHTLILTGNEAVAVTFMGADDAGAADTIFTTTGAGTVTIGGADTTNVTVNSDVGLTFAGNSESINNLANATFDFTSNTDTTVILTASDTDGVAALTVDSGGAADLTLGSADATGVDLVANGNMDITIAAGLDFIFKANEFEVQAGSVIDGNTSLPLAVDGTTVATLMDPQAAGTGGDILDLTATFAAMNGSDSSIGLDMNLTGADHAGASNELLGIDLKLTTPDAQTPEKAIAIDDADWDYAIDTAHVPIVSTAATWMDDFFGDTLQAEWIPASGSGASDPALSQAQYGTVRASTPGTDTNFATDHAGMDLGLHWSADQHSLIFEARVKIDNITNVEMCVGMTDTLTKEMPGSIAGITVTIACDDCLVFCFDTDAGTDQWYALGVTGGTPATGNALTGVAPTGGAYQVLRIEADAGGEDARFYIDGTLRGTLTANAVGEATLLTPIFIVDNLAAEAKNLDVDYVFVSAQRQ